MIFYVATDDEGSRHIKGTQADARPIDSDFATIDVPTDKAGLQQALQELFSEIDQLTAKLENTVDIASVAVKAAVKPAASSYTEWTVKIDEEWDKLGLARQLDFAAMAMDNARKFYLSETSRNQKQ